MFGLFKKSVFNHHILGDFVRRGKAWEGKLQIKPNEFVDLALEGSRDEPCPDLLQAALNLSRNLPGLLHQTSFHLLEHLEPYKEALSDPDSGFCEAFDDPAKVARVLTIETPDQALKAVSIVGFDIHHANNTMITLILIQTLWDQEHTLGAFFDDGNFVELNGSM